MENSTTAELPPTAMTAEQMLVQAHDHFRAGRYRQIPPLIERLHQLQPRNPVIWNLAAATARALGQRREAESLWQTALTLKPDYPEARYNLAILLLENKRYVEAEKNLRMVPQNIPQQVSLLNNLGVALEGQDRIEEALECYERAVTLDPRHAKAHHNCGLSLVALGRFEEGQKALETALSLATDKAPFFRSLTISKRFSKDDPQLLEMEKLAQHMESLSQKDRMELHFALAKAYSDIGEHERSLPHFLAGNAEKRRQTAYDEADTLDQFEQIRRSFTREVIASRRGSGYAAAAPVFILGMPRSGSSLVEQILASHPDVYGAGELEDFRVLAETFLSSSAGRPLHQHVAGLPADAFHQLGEQYVARLRARAPAARTITDKRPLNFLHIGLIHLALPSAKIIHTQRDSVDTCISCFSHLFNGDYPFTYDLRELGRYWRAYDELMTHWRSVLPADAMLEIRHDELVADPEGQIRRLLSYCGLEWNEACLEFHKTARPVRTASATQVRQPVYRKPPHPWRAHEACLQPLMDGLAGRTP